MNVTPRFSFNYNGKPFDLPGVKVLKEAFGYSYCTEDGLVVELHIEEYPEYGTAGWYGKGGDPGASDWYKQVGNWQVRPDEHPDGLLDGGWAAYHYDRPDLCDGVVMAFRRSGSNCETSRYKLVNLEPEKTYSVTDIDTKEKRIYKGKDLINDGLTVTISERYQSKIFIYKAI